MLLVFITFRIDTRSFRFLPGVKLGLTGVAGDSKDVGPKLGIKITTRFPVGPRFSIRPKVCCSVRKIGRSRNKVSNGVGGSCVGVPVCTGTCLCGNFCTFTKPRFNFLTHSGTDTSCGNASVSIGSGSTFGAFSFTLKVNINCRFSLNLLISVGCGVKFAGALSSNSVALGNGSVG